MILKILLVIGLLGLFAHSSPHKHLHKKLHKGGLFDMLGKNEREIHAVLVAGSNGWYNYRHQADVAHAYQVLLSHGLRPENIITFMYDDIAKSEQNPFPEQLFNKPNGPDVYSGVAIDYRSADVNPENFIAVLTGDKSKVSKRDRSSGRVLKSGPNDNVFVYFTDHGGVGLISFPEKTLSAKELNDALKKMHNRQKYNKLVFYLEACESGSMFENILPDDLNIYAITAANGHESSWGFYCDNEMKLPCLGDLFSIAWMEDSDVEDLTAETLAKQYQLVKTRTNKSHVQHFGNLSIADENVSDFQGSKKVYTVGFGVNDQIKANERNAWPSRDIKLKFLERQRDESNDLTEKKNINREIQEIYQNRRELKTLFTNIVDDLVDGDVEEKQAMLRNHRQLTQFDCHHDVVRSFDKECWKLASDDDALRWVYVLANLCEEFADSNRIIEGILRVC